MPSVTALKTNFTGGEISPLLFARVDIDKYANGAQLLENMVVERYGGARKRGGTQFIRAAKSNATKARLMPFIFSVTQAYVLEFGNEYVRFYTNGGVVAVSGTPVEVATPYTEDEVFDIQYAQSADVLYLAHPNHAPRKLSRTSATTFTLEIVDFEDGPFLEINDNETTLTPSNFGSVVPTMTSNSAPSGTVSGSAINLGDYYNVYDRNEATLTQFTSIPGNVDYDFAGSGAFTVDGYWIKNTAAFPERSPSNWKFQGFDGSNWVTLDARASETGWGGGEVRFYSFKNGTAYEGYRLIWSGTSDGGNLVSLVRMDLHQEASEQTPFNLTASSTAGINDGAGFQTSDIGRHFRVLASDGAWRWGKIVARTSTTVVTVRIYNQALPDLDPLVNWRLGAWSDETGWPGAVGFFEGRLCWARTTDNPETIWMSRVDDFINHSVSSPIQDDDAIAVTARSDSLNEVKWIAEGTDLFVGTSAAIRTVGANSPTGGFSPTNIRQKRESTFGASNIQPIRVGSVALYPGYYRKDIREVAYSIESDGYVSQDLSILSEHIPAHGVKQMAYAQSPASLVWIVLDDGSLAGLTYERDQQVIAFHRHIIGGTSVTVESVASIPGAAGDEIWVLVRRTINGSAVRYLERITAGLSDTGVIAGATFLDSHLTYSGASTGTLSGLSHLEGQQVYVWSNVGKQGPFTVASGAITLTTNVTTACVGLAYTSAIETLSPEAAARGGTAQTRLGRVSEVFLRLNRSMNGMVGPADGVQETLEYSDPNSLFTGDVRVPISMEWERGKRIRVVHSEPTPFHVLGMVAELRVSG